MTSELAIRIRALRKIRGFTQAELARRLGVSQGIMSRWEAGRHIPPSDIIAKLAELAGLPVSEFHYGPRAPASDGGAITKAGHEQISNVLPGLKMKRVTDFIPLAINAARATGRRDIAAALSIIMSECEADNVRRGTLRRSTDQATPSQPGASPDTS